MKRSRYTNEQIAHTLRQAEGGSAVAEVCRQIGISDYPTERIRFQLGAG